MQIVRRRQLWPVSIGIHHAQEPERLVDRGAKLMPCPRWDVDEIANLHIEYFGADEAATMPTQNHDRVLMVMTFERGVATGRHFEIAQLAIELWLLEQHLPLHQA